MKWQQIILSVQVKTCSAMFVAGLERRRSREDGKDYYQTFHFSRPVEKILAGQAEIPG